MGNTVQCAKACSLPEYMISVPKENGSENFFIRTASEFLQALSCH